MKKAVLLFTVLFCCIFNALAQKQIEPEEYNVYRAWLEQDFIAPDTKQIVIRKFTDANPHDITNVPRESPMLSQLQPSTLRDYKRRSRQSVVLKNNFGVSPIVKLSPENLENFFSDNSPSQDWRKEFGAEYRFSLTRVGFNKKKNQALFHVNYKSHLMPNYAFGRYYLLAKENGNWIIKKIVRSWIY